MSDGAEAAGGVFWEDAADEVALARYRTLINATDDGIYQLDADGRFVAVNDAIAETTGYAKGDLVGEHASLLLADDDVARIEREIARRLADDGERDEPFEIPVRTADGDRIRCEVRVNLLVEDGRFEGTVGIVRDVTDRRRTERSLAARERQLSERDRRLADRERQLSEREWELRRERTLTDRLLEAIPVAILVLDDDGDVVRVNERARELLGIDDGEVDGFAPEDGRVYDEQGRRVDIDDHPFARVLATGEPVYDRVLRVERPDGDRRWLSVSAVPLLTDGGEVDRVVTTGEDVTHLKERERHLERRTDELSTELDEVFGRVTDGFFALDEAWNFTHVNERAEEILGVGEEELVGTTLWEAFPELVGTTFEAEYRTALETQEPASFDAYYPPIDRWFEEHVYPSETGLSVYFRDVTEREHLRGEMESTLERITDAFYSLDVDWTFTYVNDRAEELIDVSGEGLVGKRIWEEFEWGADSKLRAQYEAVMESQEPTSFELYYPAPLDTWFEIHAYPSPTGLSVYFRDVTERKRRERELEESERRYRTLAEYFPNGIVTLFDHDLRYELAAGRAFEDLPVDPDDIEGRHFRDAWDDESADALEPALQAALEGEERSVELVYDGREWVVRVVPITDERGEVFAGMTMAQDITERKARERSLEDAKSQLEAATEAGAIGTWEWQIQEDRMVAGASFARQFGVDPEAAREGVSLEEFVSSIHEDDRERVTAKVDEAIENCGEYEAEYRVRTVDDDIRWVVARGHVECDDEGNPLSFPGALADITERKRAEMEVEKQTKELETLFRVLPVGVVVASRDGTLVRANDTAKEIWGGDVFDAESIEEFEKYAAEWADTGESVEPADWTMTRALRGEEITDPNVYKIDAFDDERRVIMELGMPVKDEYGDVSRAVVTLTDITERREYQRKLEETVGKLEESNERLEQFAYAASHDLQEPLRMISSYLKLIERRYDDVLDEDGLEFLEYAVDGADRMRGMIDGLLAYSRVETRGNPLEPLELEGVMEDVMDDLAVQIAESGAEITVEELPRVEGDRGQLRQVFQNLLSNAITYSGDEPPRVRIFAEERPNEGVIAVNDEGIGIDRAETDRIFEVFHRLHGRHEHPGSGIGLALCQRIVERHGGEIWVDSEPGEGSTFYVTLPTVTDP